MKLRLVAVASQLVWMKICWLHMTWMTVLREKASQVWWLMV